MMASFSVLGGDIPPFALIVLHNLVGSDLWSSVSTNYLNVCLRCSFVVLVISSFICCRVGEVGSLDLRVILCSHLFQYLRWDWLCIETVSTRGYMV